MLNSRVQIKSSNQKFKSKVQIKSSDQEFKSKVQIKSSDQELKSRVQIKSSNQEFKSRVQIKSSDQEKIRQTEMLKSTRHIFFKHLNHFMSLVPFNTSWKHQKTTGSPMFSGDIGKYQFYK